MAGLREIRSKIGVVQNLQKLTHAMEMVARSKIARIQACREAAQPYGERLRVIAAHLRHARVEYRSPYLTVREPVRHVGLLLVTSDKGLCGGINSRLLRRVGEQIREWQAHKVSLEVCALGLQGLNFMRRAGVPVLSQAVGLGDIPRLENLLVPMGPLLKGYRSGRLDAVVMAYTRFDSMLSQVPVLEPLLPLTGERLGAPEGDWDYLYEPEPARVVEGMLRRYLETLIYLAVAQNGVSEQAARILAMKAASDNATEAIADLHQIYHRTRQEAITRELIEIVAGGEAAG